MPVVDDETLDHFCWYLVSHLDHWYHPTETAETCIDVLKEEHDSWDEENEGWERGYHVGAYVMFEETTQFFRNVWGVEVFKRAERYREEEGLPDWEFGEGLREGHIDRALGADNVTEYLNDEF